MRINGFNEFIGIRNIRTIKEKNEKKKRLAFCLESAIFDTLMVSGG